MDKAEKYIKLIADMYSVSDKAKDRLQTNMDLLEKHLECYLWEDIKLAIEKYYTYKNDKTYPKLCQILAILDAGGKRIEAEEPLPDITAPYTSIRDLQGVFIKVCEKLHSDGIYFSEYFGKEKKIPFGNKNYVDKNTGKLLNKKWAWDDAVDVLKMNFPQEYNKFRRLTIIEKYAMAYKYGCLNIKI